MIRPPVCSNLINHCYGGSVFGATRKKETYVGNAAMQQRVTSAQRGMLCLGAAMAAATMFFATTPSSVQAASENFCTSAWLNPYGWGGDRCWATGHTTLHSVNIVTHERAGCVDIANGSNELMFSWVCGPAASSPAAAATIWDFAHEGVFRKGVIRNNNLSFGGYFDGSQGF